MTVGPITPGHRHTMSRRRLLAGMGLGAVGVLGAQVASAGPASAARGPGSPRPIPGGFQPFGSDLIEGQLRGRFRLVRYRIDTMDDFSHPRRNTRRALLEQRWQLLCHGCQSRRGRRLMYIRQSCCH